MKLLFLLACCLITVEARSLLKRHSYPPTCPPFLSLPAPPPGCYYNSTADENGCLPVICDQTNCSENEERVACGACQQRTCDPKPPVFCRMACRPACQCIRGHVRSENGTCIAESDCPPKTLDDRCKLNADQGECEALINRYFYNYQSKRCEKFTWGGCGGNANRFNTLTECEAACAIKLTTPTTTTPSTTFKPQPNPNPAGCPSRQSGGFNTCANDCKSNSDCNTGLVCCENWCGKRCIKPI